MVQFGLYIDYKRGDNMRITIGGCRDFNDYEIFKEFVKEYIEGLNDKEIVILSGHCTGTDLMAERYAWENGYETELYPAQWDKYGRAAGPKRNKEMIDKSDCVLAFWDGKSRGTGNHIETAKRLSKHVEIKYI